MKMEKNKILKVQTEHFFSIKIVDVPTFAELKVELA